MIREREGRQIEVYYQTMACVVQESDTEKEGKNMLSDLQPSVALLITEEHSLFICEIEKKLIMIFIYFVYILLLNTSNILI